MGPISESVARFAFRNASRFMPRHIKRLILWCSVYSQVRQISESIPQVRKDAIKSNGTKELNERLKLSSDCAVFTIPLLLGKIAVKEMSESMEIATKATNYDTPQELYKLSVKFSGSIPACFRYASRAMISRDFRKYFERRAIENAHPAS